MRIGIGLSSFHFTPDTNDYLVIPSDVTGG
jgi:hypothetical protein